MKSEKKITKSLEVELVKTINAKIYEHIKVKRYYFMGIMYHEKFYYYNDEAKDLKKFL